MFPSRTGNIRKILSTTLLQDCSFPCRNVPKIPSRFRSCDHRLLDVGSETFTSVAHKKPHWKSCSAFICLSRALGNYGNLNQEQNRYVASTQSLLTPVSKRNVKDGRPKIPSSLSFNRNINTASIVNACPESVQPYLRLIRFDRPIGTWLLYLPCTWSITMATDPGCLVDIKLLTLFGAGALVMRGAGCTINDMWDSDFDKKVDRTRTRPIASEQINHFQALVFLGAQLSVALAILLSLNTYSIILGASSMGLVVTYPLMKRITYWPQIVLGLAMNWGILVGWAAVKGSCDWSVCLPLYAAGFFWTMVYDTIYAHQDKNDDMKIGVKSTALLFGDQTKYWLAAFSSGMVASLAIAGVASSQTWPYFAGVCMTAAHLAWQTITVNTDKPEDCSKKFKTNKWLGVMIFAAVLSGTLLKKSEENSPENNRDLEPKVE